LGFGNRPALVSARRASENTTTAIPISRIGSRSSVSDRS
jgi:hypothetical protein